MSDSPAQLATKLATRSFALMLVCSEARTRAHRNSAWVRLERRAAPSFCCPLAHNLKWRPEDRIRVPRVRIIVEEASMARRSASTRPILAAILILALRALGVGHCGE